MNSFAHRPRLRQKVKHILSSTMLCCGKRKESREAVEAQTEEGIRRVRTRTTRHIPEMVVQKDFRKVSGISSEIFRQIEAVENDYDAATAAHVDAVERRGGEMIIRMFDPCSLGRVGAETYRKHLAAADSTHVVRFVEIIKRPGQTLGLYIREGDGFTVTEGVFISRIALESAVYNSGLLKVGDEILAVNLVDVRGMSLDDVVIIMSIPRRLVLAIRSRICSGSRIRELTRKPSETRPPVVVIKKEMEEEIEEGNSNSENGVLIRARTKGLPPDVPAIAVKLSERDIQRERHRYQSEDQCLYYNSQPRAKVHHTASRWVRPPRHHPPEQAPPPRPPVVSRQPKTRKSYPPTLESLAEQVHPFYPPSTARAEDQPHHRRTRSMAPTTSRDRYDYWDDRSATLRRSTGMLRTESDYRLPPSEYERYTSGRSGYRRSFHVSPTMQHRGRLRRYDDSRSVGILRRRPTTAIESASDTEVQSGRDYMTGTPSRYYPGRSNSLPRATRSSVADPRRHRQHQAVRFTTLPYDDSQEESDGALSAPELPATRFARRRARTSRRSPSVFTSSEYRAWMSRAPSTSAIYERLRRGKGIHQAQRMARVAHSAESLLDTIRKEEFRGIYTMPRRLRTPSEDSLPGDVVRDYTRTVPHPTPIRPSEDRLHLLSLDPRDFNKYRPERTAPVVSPTTDTMHSAKEGYSGLLWIHLLSGRGLRPTGHGDHFRDLYCVIECDHVHKARTVIRTGEHSFDWDEIFELDLVECREMAFLLYSWDPRFRHKLCYKGSLHLDTLLRESPIHSLALKMEPRGTLYLKMRYRDPRQTFERLPAPTHEGIFGVDLETVIMKEDSGHGVPLIVKRCTEEVERRGTDIVGIYRLCGSALRKKLLREEFESSALFVDLSVEHVPDINVVTSLLKDYLRELPEPLLTRGLYDMLVDGLGVCLPDDPEGNAKLMFSILECLPRANLCTVLLLLDHLRLIANHCDRNKMTSSGLASAFGPVLMCHTETTSDAVDIRRPIKIMNLLLDMWPTKRMSSESSGSSCESSDAMSSDLLEPVDLWLRERLLPESSC